ncbi:hypothetical protein P3T37_002786 [Kitasatospora sp. MAA4]|uniref:Scr1 family TA system antitoxin-like transcriptional regulator n=1 Tax=Kitasatospora sp. MAA4 TaxID=3035093 RepID=UPI00247EC3D1|nr:hypothetical protein [Kitasatospora sp. MAA4]
MLAPVRRGEATREQADERLSLLAVRQRLLERMPAVHAVLDEGVLRRPIGGKVTLAMIRAVRKELERHER